MRTTRLLAAAALAFACSGCGRLAPSTKPAEAPPPTPAAAVQGHRVDVVGTIRRAMVMTHTPTAHDPNAMTTHEEVSLVPADPEVGWAMKRLARKPSRTTAVVLTGGALEGLRQGDQVRVRGTTPDGFTLEVESVEPVGAGTFRLAARGAAAAPEVAPSLASGTVRVLVVPVQWAAHPLAAGVTSASIKMALDAWTKKHMEEECYHRCTYDFTVLDPVTVGTDADVCDIWNFWQYVVDFVDPQVDFTQWDAVVSWTPISCGWGGIASVCPTGVTTAEGARTLGLSTDVVADVNNAAKVAGHELGHNQCRYHCKGFSSAAGAVLPGGSWNPATGICEYCMQACTMGQVTPQCVGALATQIGAGIIGPSEYTVADHTGDYAIASLEAEAAVPKGLVVPLGISRQTSLYVESRQPAGECARLAGLAGSTITSGILLSVLDIAGWSQPSATLLPGPVQVPLGATPNAWTDFLTVGRSWSHPVSGDRVTLVSRAADGSAVVHVDKQPADLVAPTVTITTPENGVLDATHPLAFALADDRPTVLAWVRFSPVASPGYLVEVQPQPTGATTVAVDPCRFTADAGLAMVTPIDAAGNTGSTMAVNVAVNRGGCSGGSTTTTTSTVPRPTTTGIPTTTTAPPTTTTLGPGTLVALVTDTPDPSAPGAAVTVCFRGQHLGSSVDVPIDQGYVGNVGASCLWRADRDPLPACCAISPGPTANLDLFCYVHETGGGWSATAYEPHAVSAPPTTSTTGPPTTTTLPPPPSTTTTTTTSSSSTSSTTSTTTTAAKPTTLPTTTAKPTTTVPPTTTTTLPAPCRTAILGQRCENAACAPGTLCRSKGGQSRCVAR